jgi:DNA-binding protein H-NS
MLINQPTLDVTPVTDQVAIVLPTVELVVSKDEPQIAALADSSPVTVPVKKRISALKGTKVPPKYGDGTTTWSGRGRLPSFITKALANDPTLTKDSFLLK